MRAPENMLMQINCESPPHSAYFLHTQNRDWNTYLLAHDNLIIGSRRWPRLETI